MEYLRGGNLEHMVHGAAEPKSAARWSTPWTEP